MKVEKLELLVRAGFTENCYLIAGQDELIIVDPGGEPDKIMAAVGERKVTAIVVTHRHSDHIGALYEISERSGAPVMAHSQDIAAISGEDAVDNELLFIKGLKYCKVDVALEDDDIIELGSEKLKVLHTPGHSIGSICLYSDRDAFLISGDTLFYHTCGRVDLPTGNMSQMRKSLNRLAELPKDTKVYPGHDQSTTIAQELVFGTINR